MKGTVEWFDAAKGYGFILDEGGKDVFVHQSNILMKGFRTLEAGQSVSYELEEGERGFKAINVQVEL